MRLHRFVMTFLLASISCCISANEWVQLKGEPFVEYRERLSHFITDRKAWVNANKGAMEVEAVLPYERFPDESCSGPKIGVLMFHGLSDSPFALRDSAQALSDNCIYTRVMILPGHGTKAEDLLDVTRDDWRVAVTNATEQFSQQVDIVYLAGFSTGGALVTEYAWNNPSVVEGVVLFSPLFKINSSIDWLAPLLSPFIDWLDHHESDDYAKYASIPVPAMAEAYELAEEVRQTVVNAPARVPVFLALSEEDATVDSSVTLEVFNTAFKEHPDSEMVLYSAIKQAAFDEQVEIINTDLPEQRIFGLAHMAVHGAPHNPYYGEQGEYRICSWYLGEANRYQECREAQQNWFGERSDKLTSLSDVAARLSWNPYFDDLMKRVSIFVLDTREL
ncbi:MAG: alpha/beta fold hydrolase [Marinomonas atlantica]|nr:alpha/beta fold hydrolase [Marinomonas atlantica]